MRRRKGDPAAFHTDGGDTSAVPRAGGMLAVLKPSPPTASGEVRTPRAVIYARFSSERQKERSIERQVELCREQIERLGFEEVLVYADRGTSGLFMVGRHELHKALADAKAGLYDAFFVEDVDRIARKESDAFLIKERLQGTNVRIFDLSGELEDLTYAVKAVFAAADIRRFKRRVKLGRQRMVETGGSPHKLKFGMMRRSKGIYVPHPERAAAVVEVFTRYCKGVSRSRIARDLTGRYPTPGDCYEIDAGRAPGHLRSPWTSAMVREILRCTIYAGWIKDNATRTEYDDERSKKKVVPRPEEEVVLGEVRHSLIVDEATWMEAYVRLKGERLLAFKVRSGEATRPTIPKTSSYLLSGFVTCSCCGTRASFSHGRKREWTTVACGAA